jgi:hypothetical protein
MALTTASIVGIAVIIAIVVSAIITGVLYGITSSDPASTLTVSPTILRIERIDTGPDVTNNAFLYNIVFDMDVITNDLLVGHYGTSNVEISQAVAVPDNKYTVAVTCRPLTPGNVILGTGVDVDVTRADDTNVSMVSQLVLSEPVDVVTKVDPLEPIEIVSVELTDPSQQTWPDSDISYTITFSEPVLSHGMNVPVFNDGIAAGAFGPVVMDGISSTTAIVVFMPDGGVVPPITLNPLITRVGPDITAVGAADDGRAVHPLQTVSGTVKHIPYLYRHRTVTGTVDTSMTADKNRAISATYETDGSLLIAMDNDAKSEDNACLIFRRESGGLTYSKSTFDLEARGSTNQVAILSTTTPGFVTLLWPYGIFTPLRSSWPSYFRPHLAARHSTDGGVTFGPATQSDDPAAYLGTNDVFAARACQPLRLGDKVAIDANKNVIYGKGDDMNNDPWETGDKYATGFPQASTKCMLVVEDTIYISFVEYGEALAQVFFNVSLDGGVSWVHDEGNGFLLSTDYANHQTSIVMIDDVLYVFYAHAESQSNSNFSPYYRSCHNPTSTTPEFSPRVSILPDEQYIHAPFPLTAGVVSTPYGDRPSVVYMTADEGQHILIRYCKDTETGEWSEPIAIHDTGGQYALMNYNLSGPTYDKVKNVQTMAFYDSVASRLSVFDIAIV